MSDESTWVKPFAIASAIGLAIIAIYIFALAWYGMWLDNREARQWAVSDGYCNIAVVPIQGDIVAFEGDSIYASQEYTSAPIGTSGDFVERYIRAAEADPAVAGIVAQIDSYGGYAAPGYQIMQSLKGSPLPSVAYIREVGTSAGYLAALGADTIVASPYASVGSIGVTYSYVENVEKNKKEGLNFVQLSSGAFKDTGNPNKPLSAEERALYQRDIEIFADVFVQDVAVSRGLEPEYVRTLADGSSMPAALALEKKLIDAVGDEHTIRTWFAEQLGMAPEEIILCK